MVDLRDAISRNPPALDFDLEKQAWSFVRIASGQFVMGTPADEAGREQSEPLPRPVRIARPFYLARCPATRVQYMTVMGRDPAIPPGGRLAMDQLTYVQAVAFTQRLAELIGLTVTLPTEAQWEYACRAGTGTPYYSGGTPADLDRIAWYSANAGNAVHDVGQKTPNAWGLHDMLGNVYEPCIDTVLSFDALKPNNPIGRRFADHGTMRGGAWMTDARFCRAGARMESNDMFGGMGVRVAINV